MPPAPPADAVPSFWRDLTLAHAANGLVGFLFAASGPLAIILATATRGGLSEAERRRVKRGLPPVRQPGEGRQSENDDSDDDRFEGEI